MITYSSFFFYLTMVLAYLFCFLARNKCINNAALSVAGILLLVFQNTFDTGKIKYQLKYLAKFFMLYFVISITFTTS